MEGEDIELLRDYAAHKSEAAFRALVERHVDMVYATALRQVHDVHLAEEATQAVFMALAKKAEALPPNTILVGWLFRAAQLAGAKVQRTEARRKHWEQQAAQMQPLVSDGESAWDQIAPHLNDALNQLKEPDRSAIILRFFESKSIAQVGNALGLGESATKMRISRALEHLREIFQGRGIVLPVALLTTALSVPATHAAPVGLAGAVATSALLRHTTTSLLAKGTLLLMTAKSKIAIAAVVALLLFSGTTALVTYQVAKYWKKQTAPVASEPVKEDVMVVTEFAGTEPSDGVKPVKRARLSLVTSEGTILETNGTHELVLVDGNGTSRIKISPGGPARAVTRFRVKAAPGNAEENVTETPVPPQQ